MLFHQAGLELGIGEQPLPMGPDIQIYDIRDGIEYRNRIGLFDALLRL